MRKIVVVFAVVTGTFILLAFVIKSKYYYVPYPNLIDYFLSFMLLLLTVMTVARSKNHGRKKIIAGLLSLIVFMGSINLLNLVCEWHPLTLNLPFSESQSFEIDNEPFEWETDSPGSYGYRDEAFAAYFDSIGEWNRLRSVLVVKGDKLIVERYFSGATRYSAFNVHSITKSITSALVGAAIMHGHIKSDDDSVLSFFPEYRDHPFGKFKKALTIKHLLSMRGGWASGDGHQTADECITEEYLHRMPNSEFKYFTGSQNVLSAIITKQTNQSTKEFAERSVFNPLGIKIGFWRRLGDYYCGGDESYFTARDLARFGHMYLRKGRVDGKQLLDSAWVEKSFFNYSESSDEFRSLQSYQEIGYGLCWWIFKTKSGQTIYSARGKGGQHMMLMPEKDLVIVILQEWNPLKKNAEEEDRLLGELLAML